MARGNRRNNEWLSTGEAARLLGISLSTVRLMIKTGRLRARRLDGRSHWRIAQGEIKLLLATRSNSHTT